MATTNITIKLDAQKTMNTREEEEFSFDVEFAAHVREGLSAKKKHLDPRYFYDGQGSRLFEEICRQPEYYPTRIETSILQEQGSGIIDAAGDGKLALVEFGSGSSTKTKMLIKEILARQDGLDYFPIDISLSVLVEASARLEAEFAGLNVRQVHSDYAAGIDQIKKAEGRKIIIFLGSSIGNFEPDDAISFLSDVGSRMEERDLLIVGFDLQKDAGVLYRAYNDGKGVTARFNRNLLARINKELGGEFELANFEHRAIYNKKKGRIEMYLVSSKDQNVNVKRAGTFHFRLGETIHTENSYKYTTRQIEELAKKSGLIVRRHFTDSKRWFDLALLKPGRKHI